MWKPIKTAKTLMQSNPIRSSRFTDDVINPQTNYKYMMHVIITYFGVAWGYGYIDTRSKLCDDPEFSNKNHSMNVLAFYGGIRNMCYMAIYPVVGPLNYVSFLVRRNRENK